MIRLHHAGGHGPATAPAASVLGLLVIAAAILTQPAPPAVAQPAATIEGAPADALQPGSNDRQITLAVRSYLEREHFHRRAIDDEIAHRWFDVFLKSLDPMKVYFLQSDIDAFGRKRDLLDDLVKRGDVSFAYEVFGRFLQRVDARMPLIERLLAQPHDFTKPESIATDPDLTTWAANEAEVEDALRKQIKYDLLVKRAEKTPDEEAKDSLLRRYRSFAKRMHQMTSDELLETYLSSLTASLDPHTSFMSPGTQENFDIAMRLQLDGIGASLKAEDGYTTVMDVVPGGAADKDGRLNRKDRVVGVGQGADGEIVDVIDKNLNDVVQLIRGKRGTVVRLKVIPVGETVPKVYDIVRAKIELKDAEARAEVIEQGQKADGRPFKIGVINLPSFYLDMAGARQGQADFKSSTRDCRRLLDDFKRQGVDCVVLDLRNNGGGSLPESISLTGLFIDTGPVVQIKDADKRVQVHPDVEPGVAWDGPLVVLINKFSASASEIVAGAIQDYRRGLVVGDEATHGKGTVQSLIDIGQQLFLRLPNPPSLGAIKITNAQFYRPSGLSTQLEGVKSDVELPSITSHLPFGESDLDHAIAFDKVPQAEFKPTGPVSDDMLAVLRERSAARVAANEEFAKVAARIAAYKKRKDEKTMSLVETEFTRQRNEGKAADDEEKRMEEESESRQRPVVKRDFYFDEAMNVTVDYMKALAGGTASLARTTPSSTEAARLQPVPTR